MPTSVIRLASIHDLDALEQLENVCFSVDRFNRDQIEYLLSRAHATIFVLEQDNRVGGGAYMLWREAHHAGRLYNIAVHPSLQGTGLGDRLLAECEVECAYRGCDRINLEVRVDNARAIAFYEKHGYRRDRILTDYYEDGSEALRMVKALPGYPPRPVRHKVPYYPQTLDFTCGPAAVMMAIKYFRPAVRLTKALELAIWKEATLVFMKSGIGGTDPYGLALAARRRGLSVRIISSTDSVPFISSVRIPQKQEIIRLLHEEMETQALEAGICDASFQFSLMDLASAIHRGMIPITLVSTYRLTGKKMPHWVVVTGFDRNKVYLHDPDLDSHRGERKRARNVALSRQEFRLMYRYGKDIYGCAIIIGPPQPSAR